MKILGICGSPRKGNTEFMLKTVLNAAKGAETELILLREKNIKHCQGCLSCDKSNVCVIKDDMQELYKKLEGADVLVIGTPNYYDNVPGLMKDFIDRTNPYYETDTLKGKKVVVLIVGGEGKGEPVIEALKHFINAHKMKHSEKLTFKALDADEIQKNKQAIEKLKKLGESLL